jgi:hypothetical protein
MECGPVERNVLLLMSGWADPDGTNIIQSYDSIARVTGYSKSAVRLAVEFWLALEVLILVKPGGGRGHAPQYAIDLTKVESFILADKGAAPEHLLDNKGAVEKHLSGNGKVPPETTKGAVKVQKGAVERHPPSLPSLPDKNTGESSQRDPVENSEHESSNGDRLDDFKKKVLAKCEDPNGQLAVALDVIVERVRRSGINVTSQKYLEAALHRFDFQGGQDREDWMVANRGRAGDR